MYVWITDSTRFTVRTSRYEFQCLPFGSPNDEQLSQMRGDRKVEPSKVLCLLYHSWLSATCQLFFLPSMFSI